MRQFDKNGDGVIDRSFVPEALKLFGVITTGYEATKICDYFDKNGSYYMTYHTCYDLCIIIQYMSQCVLCIVYNI